MNYIIEFICIMVGLSLGGVICWYLYVELPFYLRKKWKASKWFHRLNDKNVG